MIVRLLEVADHWDLESPHWSPAENAAHLANVDQECFMDRMTRISVGENPTFSYHHDTGRRFARDGLETWIARWRENRQEIIVLVRGLDDSALEQTGQHATFGPLTIAGVLQLIIEHDGDHLEDLNGQLQEQSI
jgi:hypothetical protein